ncbi:2-isopropylmalate synthase [Loigolactobacillus zhaoyuanensis]|uniref:2-isopropylmalate synthase n=1 Tax=Loigolactobacillus zhaoyuanensis TaxID=2486017 RepID=A0ABW8UI83_9LACO|nr:2-isopropylmalate synthase [Loigolactobacillus zhaoyuanensis]
MKKIQFFDTTLRDGEQTIGVNYSIKQKVEIAKQLEKWGVDVIEAGFPIASPEDFAACKAVSEAVTHTMITGLARCKNADIDSCVQATQNAQIKQIHVFIATSPIHREDKLHMTKEEVIQSIHDHVAYAKRFFDIVQFSPEDATRTELDFLAEAVQTAIDAGATVINIPDTVGYTNPKEFAHLFQYLQQQIANFDDITFSSHCHNDLGMATANTLAAIENGATRVEGTINGIGEHAGNVALEQIAANFYVRRDYYQCEDNINLEYTKETSEMVSRYSDMTVANNQPVTGVNCFSIESGIHQDGFLKNPQTYEILTPATVGMPATALPLGKLSGSHAVMDKLNHIGYDVDRGDMRRIFPRFKNIADQTKLVSDAELHTMMQDYKKDVISA